jgi:ferredoxin
LADVEERRVGALTVRIDRLICVGFGDCIEASPASFELDGDGIATFRAAVDDVSESELVEACRKCPVDALTVLGADGKQVVP